MKQPTICVLYGGVGGERDVSLASGTAVIAALEQKYDLHPYDITQPEVPVFVDPKSYIVLPILHGRFGENGTMQQALDDAGVAYAGCGPAASALCMDKVRTKKIAVELNIEAAASVVFDVSSIPAWSDVSELLGDSFVIKPVDDGSSVGLHLVEDEGSFFKACSGVGEGRWMAESRIRGNEVSVGVLDGSAMGVVGIRPAGGVYDYQRKYTPGDSEYDLPARLPEPVLRGVETAAESLFAACGCRDFARVDFIVNGRNEPVLLEANTLPGMTPTSLLPKSASCLGIDFEGLLDRMLAGAHKRWEERYG